METLLLALASGSCLLSASLLALSQQRNWRAVTAAPYPSAIRSTARPLAYGLMGLALMLCVARDGGSFAALLWPLLLGAAGLAVTLVIAYRPRWLRPLTCPFAQR
ncbi:MAG: DUF3325 domain-containing protein [Pseudomonadota bacterium]